MIPSVKEHNMKLVQFVLTADNNPLKWTEESLKESLRGQVIVGYILRNDTGKFETITPILNLYVIQAKYLVEESVSSIITLAAVQQVFRQWLESLMEDSNSIMFRNPPIKEWLDTKENWAKKLASTLSKSYNKPVDECLSTVYYVIMSCYNNSGIYMGSLNYISVAAHNNIRKEFDYMKNRLTGNHPMAVHLDASPGDFNGNNEESVESFHELIGKADPFYEQQEFNELKNLVLEDLGKEFSKREIDQIFNMPEYLPNSVYRKLLKWRKEHSLEDYK